ncbi:7132_t:CDS:10 [Cetraspora pellucida]|uniref:7132_t:CDS:1 n=1 Tax=Cetraspora pellucida TaxID=1433469 RepID=A0ACA9K682_9GLOM|nr:7132_t:CDS:10 [Cetraspora pellucida]
MGKPKNQPRIKGNVQPASSSRAAEIIATGGSQVPAGNLGGFAQFLGGAPFSASKSLTTETTVDKMTDVNLDPNLVLIFKRLSKRDTTTKLKALEELEAYLRGKEENEIDLVNITGVWAKFFVKLAIEVDRRIRYTTYTCHLLIVSKVKKRLASSLKEIIGVWIISLFDQYKDVARVAMESFQTAFPAGKRVEVLIFCQMEILSYISDTIIHKTPETLSDPRFTSEEDMISKYDRVVACSYYSLAHLIDQLNEDSLLKAAQQYDGLFDNPKTWTNLTSSNPLVHVSDVLPHKLQSLIVNVINDDTILTSDSKLEDNFKEFCQRLADFFVALSSMAKTESRQENSNDAVTNMALKSFLSDSLIDIVRTTPMTCLDYVLDLFVSCLSCNTEFPEAQYNWNRLVQSFLEIEPLESKLDGLYILISKVVDIKTSISFLVEQLNEYLIALSNQLLYQHFGSATRTKIENLLCIMFLFKGSLLMSETKLKILNDLAKAIISCSNGYYIVEDSTIPNEVALSVLHIFAKLFKDGEFIEFFLCSDLLLVSGHIFELTFVNPHEGFNAEVINNIQQLAQECWDRIVISSRSHPREAILINNVSRQIKSSLLNAHYSASPTDFALRVKKLCSFYENDCLKSQEIIKLFHIDNEIWRELSEPFLSSIDPSLSIVDPMILPFNIGQRNGQQNDGQTTIVAYDSYGLSVYGRLGLFLIELIHKIGVDSFFGGSHKKIDTQDDISYSNCNRILLELLLVYVLCADIRRSRKSDHHLWDAFNIEESDYRGFKAFLVDVRLIVKNYTLQMLQNEQLDVKFILNNLNSTVISHNVQHNGISGLLCEAIKRSHSENSVYWARVLHILYSEVIAAASISLKQAEEFLDVIKLEHMNLITKMAFILSLKTFLGASTKYKDFQNDLAVKLISLDPVEIFRTESLENNDGLMCLCLLITSTSKEDEMFLSPDKSINLLIRIQEWSNIMDPNIWSIPTFSSIHILIAKLLCPLVTTVQEFSGNHWNFIFELLQYWLQEISRLELLYEAIHIFRQLNSIAAYSTNKSDIYTDNSAEDTDNSLTSKLITYKTLLYQQLSLLLFQEKDHRDEVFSYQYCTYLEILCEVCHDLPKEILANKKDELYALLLIPHEGIQKCAYKLAHILINEKVLSEWFEFLGTSGKSDFYDMDISSKFFYQIFETLGHMGQTTPYNLSKWDVREFYIEAFELQFSAVFGFPLLCAHLYYRSLRQIPSIVRTWWSDCKKRQLSISVDSYTEKYFSPIIIQGQLDMLQSEDVKSQLEDEKFTIRIARSSNEVIAAFNVDEYIMELSVRMPNNFPLRQAEFSTLERMGTTEVKDLKWAKLPVQTIVNSQNSNLDVALNLFKNNINLRFRGVEDCTICYSVVSLDDRSLPTKKCNTYAYQCTNYSGSEVRIRQVVRFAEDYFNEFTNYGYERYINFN